MGLTKQTFGPNISTVTVSKDNVDGKDYYAIDLRVVDADGVKVVTVGFVTKSGAVENTSMVLKEGDQYDGWYKRAISTPDEPIKKLEIWALDQKGNESLKEIAYKDLLIHTTY